MSFGFALDTAECSCAKPRTDCPRVHEVAAPRKMVPLRIVVIVKVGHQAIDQCDLVGRIFQAAYGTGQKPRRLRRSASAREDLRTAIKTNPGLEVPAPDLTLDRQCQAYHKG
jgi:hypothetical protein